MKAENLQEPYKIRAGHRMYKNCPECGSDKWKLWVHTFTGSWYCFSGQHGAGGRIFDWSMVEFPEFVQTSLAWEDFDDVVMTGHDPDFQGQNYLSSRNIHAKGLKLLQSCGRIYVPYYAPDGRVIYYSARAITGQGIKYIHSPGPKPLYIPSLAFPKTPRKFSHLVLVEGVFDAIRLFDRGYNVASLGGKRLSLQQKCLLDEVRRPGIKICLVLDSDAGLDVLYQSFSDRLWDYNWQAVMLPDGTDPATLSDEQIQDLIPEEYKDGRA